MRVGSPSVLGAPPWIAGDLRLGALEVPLPLQRSEMTNMKGGPLSDWEGQTQLIPDWGNSLARLSRLQLPLAK